MARGMAGEIDGNVEDPRWEGQDSQSLPDRPAHPDPSKVTEFGSAESVPSHGIVGHLDKKHGIVSDGDLRPADAKDPAPVGANDLAREVLTGKVEPSVDVESSGRAESKSSARSQAEKR
jgi:hypothetical protein